MAAANKQRDRTEVKTENFTYEWEIHNFQLLHHDTADVLEPPIFYMGDDKIEWCLQMYPRGEDELFVNYVSLNLCLKSEGSASLGITVRYQMSILKSGTVIVEDSFIHNFEKLETSGFPEFANRKELIDFCNSDDSFIIQCKLERPLTIVTRPARPVMSFNLNNYQLGEDCKQLMKEPNLLCDVVIIVGDEKLRAHKSLLAARSSVFAAMFTQDCKRNNANVVDIRDMDLEVVQSMLEFIYTDHVTNLKALADKLIIAANKYELKRLKVMCEQALYETLDMENAVGVLLVVGKYGSAELTQYVIEFISDHFQEVAQSEAYKKMDDPELWRKLVNSMAARQE